MTYLLDTSIIIEVLRNNPLIKAFVDERPEDIFLTSVICEAETWEGIFREKENFDKKKKELEKFLLSLDKILSFDSGQAKIAGELRSDLALKGELIGDLDILIAACAVKNNAALWTKNPKHFEKIKNLQVL